MGTQKVFKMKFYEINTPAENIILILFFRKNNFQSTQNELPNYRTVLKVYYLY